jgi:hypothetical protein
VERSPKRSNILPNASNILLWHNKQAQFLGSFAFSQQVWHHSNNKHGLGVWCHNNNKQNMDGKENPRYDVDA